MDRQDTQPGQSGGDRKGEGAIVGIMKLRQETTRGMWLGFFLAVGAIILYLLVQLMGSTGGGQGKAETIYSDPVGGMRSRADSVAEMNRRIEGM